MTAQSIFKQNGFTLIEISIVIVIASILLGGAISVFTTQMENARITNTKEKQQAIYEALQNFVIRNQRLPCPADPALSEADANYGIESATPGTCNGADIFLSGIEQNARGIVPWRSLSLNDEGALDGFARRITYQVLLSETRNSAVDNDGLEGNIFIKDSASGNIINLLNPAVVALVSHGKDGYGAYLPHTGTQSDAGPATALDSRENFDDDAEFVQKAYSSDPDQPYDDLVYWIKPENLNTLLQEQGMMTPPPLALQVQLTRIRDALSAIVAADNVDIDGTGWRMLGRRLPYADCTSSANGTADVGCSSGSSPWIDIGLPETATVDPWGSYIEYELNDSLASDGMTLTTPSAGAAQFTLRSLGEDLSSGTADDTVITLGVSEFRGNLLRAGVMFDDDSAAAGGGGGGGSGGNAPGNGNGNNGNGQGNGGPSGNTPGNGNGNNGNGQGNGGPAG